MRQPTFCFSLNILCCFVVDIPYHGFFYKRKQHLQLWFALIFSFKLTASYGQLLMVHPLIQGTRKGKYTAAEKYGILVVEEGWGLFTAKKTRAGNWESDRKTQCRFPPSFVLQHFFSVMIMSVRLECVCLLHIFLCVIKRTIDFGWALA